MEYIDILEIQEIEPEKVTNEMSGKQEENLGSRKPSERKMPKKARAWKC